MKNFWSRLSIAYKIFVAMLIVFSTVQIITIAYIWKVESKILIEKEEKNLKRQLFEKALFLNTHMASLAKETRFLAGLEVMDDLIAKDIDKRVSTILKRRADDLGEDIVIVAMNDDSLLASSSKRFDSKNLKKPNLDYLYLYAPVFASFDKKKMIATITMLYPLKNLSNLKTDDPNKILWLTPPKPLNIFKKPSVKDTIFVSQKLNGVLKDWTLNLSFAKKEALSTLKHIQKILFYTFLFTIILLAGAIFLLSKRLTNPINKLSLTVTEIIKTKDYTKQAKIDSKDEIGQLCDSFNKLIIKTAKLMEDIRKQEKIHHIQLMELIHFFNDLINTKTEDETIKTALLHIKTFSKASDANYIPADKNIKNLKKDFPIKMYDYDTKEIKTLGYFLLDGVDERLIGKKLFGSFCKMIKLQLEHIQLLKTTTKALEAKSTFLSIISHDLKTPLGSILNLTQHLMINQNFTEDEYAMLRRIEVSAEHLLSMINNILQLSKLESNSITPHRETVNLNTVLDEIFDILEPLIQEKNLNLVKSSHIKNSEISSDENILKQIFINLLSNAIKFTRKGKIDVMLKQDKDTYIFKVTDSGRGIDPKRQRFLFQPFYQTNVDMNNLQNGSGLGLALSQKMARLLQGYITIYSEGNQKGTTATFTFKSFDSKTDSSDSLYQF